MKHLYQETQIIALDIPKIYNTHSINRYIISVNVNTKLNKISQYLGIWYLYIYKYVFIEVSICAVNLVR